MNPLLDRCTVCGMRATKPGSGICIRCEIAALINLSFDRIRAAIRGNVPATGRRFLSNGNKRLRMTAIREIKGE